MYNSKLIREAIKRKKFTVYRLSGATGLSPQTIQNAKDGLNVTAETLAKLANVLDIDIQILAEPEDRKAGAAK